MPHLEFYRNNAANYEETFSFVSLITYFHSLLRVHVVRATVFDIFTFPSNPSLSLHSFLSLHNDQKRHQKNSSHFKMTIYQDTVFYVPIMDLNISPQPSGVTALRKKQSYSNSLYGLGFTKLSRTWFQLDFIHI